MRHTTGSAALAALAGVVVLAGCSTAEHSAAGRPAVSAPSGTATTAEPPAGDDPRFTARLPIAEYSFTDQQTSAIDAAVSVLTDRCMRRYGMTFRAPGQPPPLARESADRRYGLSSAFDAAHYGYHLTPDEESAQAPADPVRSGTAQYLVLFGRKDARQPDATTAVSYHGRAVPVGGCRGEAATAMGAYDDPSASQTASDIASGSYAASAKDPAVRKATGAWSACMRAKGFDYPTPMDALGDNAFLSGAAPSARELATAKADMACKDSTGLLDTWFAAESRIQRGMIASRQADLTRLKSAHAAKVAAAEKIAQGT
ncbi:hypothetical protein [Streptomyces sp. CA-111067]|uniref:hypothetical protein n=1 Tax=Streptomyces sp. CA-111067 TaxID=3240046 RepID=UPI003D97A0C1